MATTAARILIADDQADVLEALRLLLKGEGFLIDVVESPRAALKALRASQLPLEEGLAAELRAYEDCLYSEDRREALRAFQEKRKPKFEGR